MGADRGAAAADRRAGAIVRGMLPAASATSACVKPQPSASFPAVVKQVPMPSWNYKLKSTAVTAAVLALLVVGLLIVWWDCYALLSLITGVALGWAVGVLLAPYDNEKKKFDNWSKALLGFVGGYGLTKIEAVLAGMPTKTKDTLFDMIVFRRFWIAAVGFLITAIVVFVFRSYDA